MKTTKKILILVAIVICLLIAVVIYMVYGNTEKRIKHLIAPFYKQITSIEITDETTGTYKPVTITDKALIDNIINKLANSSTDLSPCKCPVTISIKFCYSNDTKFVVDIYKHDNMFSLEGTGGE